MSIHHRSQGAINRRREAIKQRIKQGHFDAWLLKERNKRRRRYGLPPLPPPQESEPAEPDAKQIKNDDLAVLSPKELLGLLAFWLALLVLL